MAVEERMREALRSAGLRVTDQRLAILRLLYSSAVHLTAEDLHRQLQEQGKSTGLATVYRNLAKLSEADIVESHYLGPDHHKEHFEMVVDQVHFHFVCRRCGQVYEFETDALDRLKAELAAQKGWILEETCMCFEGLCHRCAN